MEEGRSVFSILTGKPSGKRNLGGPRRRSEDTNRMDLNEKYIITKNWVDSNQDGDFWRALVDATLNLRFP